MEEEYRYMVWNDLQNEYQFPNICETTEKGVNILLFKFIGNDSRKQRFKIVKLKKEEAYEIRQKLKDKYKAQRLHRELENIPYIELLELVKRNREYKVGKI